MELGFELNSLFSVNFYYCVRISNLLNYWIKFNEIQIKIFEVSERMMFYTIQTLMVRGYRVIRFEVIYVFP